MKKLTFILIPFEKITFESELTSLEIKEKLEYLASQRDEKNKDLRFKGKIGLNAFKLIKQNSWARSFNPIIIGKIIEKEKVATVTIYQRLSVITILFSLVWTIFATIGFFSIFKEINSENGYNFLFVLFAYFTSIIGFKNESIQTRIQLQKILKRKYK